MNYPEKPARIFAILTGCLALLLVSACSSTWQYVKFPDQNRKVADPFKGRIYVIRLSDTNAVAPVDIADGYEPIGSLRPLGYLCWERPPDMVTVRSSSKGESQISFKVVAGGVYFVFLRVGPGRFAATSSLEIVNEEEGQAALKDCKPPKMHVLVMSSGPSLSGPIPWVGVPFR
jgi:hypothetical protein